MIFKERQLDNYSDLAWASGTPSKKMSLPRDRFIQQMYLRLKITGDTGASVTAGEDKAAKLIRAIRLSRSGEQVVNIPGQDLYYSNIFDLGKVGTNSLITATGQSGVTLGETELVLPFMLFPKHEMECNAVLPAHMESSLDLFVDWGASADLGSGYTVTAAEVRVLLKEVDLNAADLKRLGKIFALYISNEEKTLDATYTNYTFEKDIPVGKIHNRIYLTAINNSVRSTSIVSAFKVVLPDFDVAKQDFDASQERQARRAGIPSANIITGFTSLGIEGQGGVDARRLKATQLKYKHNNGSPTATAKVRLVYFELK